MIRDRFPANRSALGSAPDNLWLARSHHLFHVTKNGMVTQGDEKLHYGVMTMHGSSPNDIWLLSMGPALHYDGTGWKPGYVGLDEPTGVFVTGEGKAWAVGRVGTQKSGYKGSLWRLAGGIWSEDPIVKNMKLGSNLTIHGSSASNVWVTSGHELSNDGRLLLRWNGTEWTSMPLPEGDEPMVATWVNEKDDVWIRRSSSLTNWNGAIWKISQLPGLPLGGSLLGVPGSLWLGGGPGHALRRSLP